MFHDIYHVGYLTDDNAAAIEFYVKVFEATLIGEGLSANGTSKMAFLKVGNTEVEFIEAPDRVRGAGKGSILLDHIGYLVPDIEQALESAYTSGREHEAYTRDRLVKRARQANGRFGPMARKE